MQWELIRLRKEHNLYQEYVAKVLGISANSYGMKERGETQFTADEMFILRDLFGLPLEKIFLPRKLGNTEIRKVKI